MTISKKDLADLAFNGLRFYLKEKLEGFEYHTMNFLQVKVMGLEFKLKNAKDTFKPRRSNTHILDHDSDSSDDDSKEVYAAEFFLAIKGQTQFSSVSQADSKESVRGAEIYF